MAERLTQLLAQIRICQHCQNELPLGAKPIVQAGIKSRILIAGQAPGRITHQKGIPFDDPSGERLRRWLGVDRASFYNPDNFAIVPMGFCFPGSYDKQGAKRGDKPPPPACAPKWRKTLLEQLPNIQLTLIIGQYAMAYHLDEPISLTQAVQQWHDFWPDRLVMPHPSPRNNLWLKRNPLFESQLVPKLQVRVADLLTQSP